MDRRDFLAALVGLGATTRVVGFSPEAHVVTHGAEPMVPAPLAHPAWPTKLWISAFHSHTEQYLPPGLIGRVTGNAITLTGSSTDPAQITRELDRTRRDHPASPIICVPTWEADQPQYVGRIVAWWTAGADEPGLASAVSAAHAHTPKAVWAYLDRRGWPSSRPYWVTEQVLPSIQCYRNPGESLADFDRAVRRDLDAVESYDRPCVLTLAFYDRLGGYSEMKEQQYAISVLLRGWVSDYPVVGLHLFADRRPGGMLDYNLYPAAERLALANPTRPNRYDHWDHGDPMAVFRNKLNQTTPLIVLSDREKATLRAWIGV